MWTALIAIVVTLVLLIIGFLFGLVVGSLLEQNKSLVYRRDHEQK